MIRRAAIAAWVLMQWGCEDIPAPAVDPDADGGAECAEAETRPCPEPGGCPGAISRCVAGAWAACEAPAEACDGQDNDCDGTVDEGLTDCAACEQPGVWNESTWNCAVWQ